MATKPSVRIPNWASTGTKSDPGGAKEAAGWDVSERMPAGWLNWLDNARDQWLEYFEDKTDGQAEALYEDDGDDFTLLRTAFRDDGLTSLINWFAHDTGAALASNATYSAGQWSQGTGLISPSVIEFYDQASVLPRIVLRQGLSGGSFSQERQLSTPFFAAGVIETGATPTVAVDAMFNVASVNYIGTTIVEVATNLGASGNDFAFATGTAEQNRYSVGAVAVTGNTFRFAVSDLLNGGATIDLTTTTVRINFTVGGRGQ